jgi:hypothetical protein
MCPGVRAVKRRFSGADTAATGPRPGLTFSALNMDPRQIFGCLLLILGGYGLLQSERLGWRKAGMALLWLGSGLAVYLFTHSPWLAGLMLLAWIFFPLWEMLFVLRQLRVPRHRKLSDARAPRDEFEELSGMSTQLTDAGFEIIDECRLQPAQHEQYYRVFVRADGLVHATIGYVAQGAIGFHFTAFTSETRDGRRWVTWDYPLTYGLVMPPETAVFRALHCETVAELYQAHLDFIAANDLAPDTLVRVEPTREAVRARLEDTLNQQIEYNILRGYLAPVTGPDESFSYSWRGTLYVAGQILRDLLF